MNYRIYFLLLATNSLRASEPATVKLESVKTEIKKQPQKTTIKTTIVDVDRRVIKRAPDVMCAIHGWRLLHRVCPVCEGADQK